MSKGYKKLKAGRKVKVAECYLTDEVNLNQDTSPTAIIFSEPSDDEDLVGIQYDCGNLDYVPQSILEVI